MQAGFAAVDITPEVGAPLNGFIARLSVSIGVDVPLFARALYLRSQETACLISSLDVLGLSQESADRLARRIGDRLGLPANHVILAASHTHSGPMTVCLRGLGEADPAYLAMVEARVCEAAASARSVARPVEVAWGAAPVEISINRREIRPDTGEAVLGINPEGPRDPIVRVLRLTAGNESFLLFEHACHPYCLGSEHTLISADFWGHAAAFLGQAGYESVYLNGCSGNIAPRSAFQGPDGARRTGQALAEAVLRAGETARPEPEPVLQVASTDILLPHDALPPLAELEGALDGPDRTVRPEESGNTVVQQRLRAAWSGWLKDLKQAVATHGVLAPIPCRLSVVRLGRGAIVALPGEVFYEIGARLGERLDADPVCMAAYCHGYVGYVPDAAAFAFGGYEVQEAHRYMGLWRVSPQSEIILTDEVMALWRKVGGRLR